MDQTRTPALPLPVPSFVKAPAIAIIVVTALGIVIAVSSTVATVLGIPHPFESGMGANVGSAEAGGGLSSALWINLFAVAIQALTSFGAFQMLRGRRFGLALTSAILVMTAWGPRASPVSVSASGRSSC